MPQLREHQFRVQGEVQSLQHATAWRQALRSNAADGAAHLSVHCDADAGAAFGITDESAPTAAELAPAAVDAIFAKFCNP